LMLNLLQSFVTDLIYCFHGLALFESK